MHFSSECAHKAESLPWTQDAKSKDGIASTKVREAINRIKKPAVLNALFANTLH